MKTAIFILVIGDSIAHGWSPYLPGARYADFNNCRSSRYQVQHVDEWQRNKRWNVIVFNCGLWDVKDIPLKDFGDKWGRIPLDEYENNLRIIIAHMNAEHIYFCTTTPGRPKDVQHRTSDLVDKYNAVALKVMREEGIRVIDLNGLAAKHHEWWLSESDVHYTEEGYKQMAEYVKHALTP